MSSDLWSAATHDAEAEAMDHHVTSARIAAVEMWPFLSEARTASEFENRKALVCDRLDSIVSTMLPNDPVAFSVVRASLEAGFDEDFAVLTASREIDQRKEAVVRASTQATLAAKTAEAAARARVEATLRKKADSSTDTTPGRWVAEVTGTGEGTWSRNSMTYATREEAEAAVRDLAGRWFGMDMARVRQIPEGGLPRGEAMDPSDPDIVLNYRTSSRKQAASDTICPYCDFVGSHDEVGKHIDEAGPDHQANGTVTDQINTKIMGRRRTAGPDALCSYCGAPDHTIEQGHPDVVDSYSRHRDTGDNAWDRTDVDNDDKLAFRRANRKIAERQVDLDAETGEYVGSEWAPSPEDPNTLVQSDETFGKNPRFKTEEEGTSWVGESADVTEDPETPVADPATVKDTTKADAAPAKLPAQFDKEKSSARRTANWVVSGSTSSAPTTAFVSRHPFPPTPSGDLGSNWRDSRRQSARVTAGHQCVYTGEAHHSDDLIEVYSGRAEPTYICGYHEQSLGVPQGAQASRRATQTFGGRDGTQLACLTCGGSLDQRTDNSIRGFHWVHRDPCETGHEPLPAWHSNPEGFDEQAYERFMTSSRHTVSWLDEAREIVETNSYQTVEGMILDLYSASLMVQVYDALGEANKAKFAAMPLAQAHDMAFKLNTKVSSKTATFYCTTHDVFVGDGNRDTHAGDDCHVEQRKSKEAEGSRRTAASYSDGYANGQRDYNDGSDPQGVGLAGGEPTEYEQGYWEGYGDALNARRARTARRTTAANPWTPEGGNDSDPNYFAENESGDGGKTTTVDGVKVHTFATTGQAYNNSQTSDDIHDGDVLAVPSEGVYGFLNEAWPICVVQTKGSPGEFHTLKAGMNPGDIEGGKYAHAAEVAKRISTTGRRRQAGFLSTVPDGYELTGDIVESACDTCGTPVPFERCETIGGGGSGFTTLISAKDDGSGSDYLGIWCSQHIPANRTVGSRVRTANPYAMSGNPYSVPETPEMPNEDFDGPANPEPVPEMPMTTRPRQIPGGGGDSMTTANYVRPRRMPMDRQPKRPKATRVERKAR